MSKENNEIELNTYLSWKQKYNKLFEFFIYFKILYIFAFLK